MRPLLPSLLLVALPGIGCVSAVHGDMRNAALGRVPEAPEARVIFYRPPTFWRNTSTWEIRDGERLVGHLENGGALDYRCPPGKRIFLLVPGSAMAVQADLAGGRTYFVELEVQVDFVAVFALRPRRLSDEADRKACDENFGRCGIRELQPERPDRTKPEKLAELRKRLEGIGSAETLKLGRDDGE